MQLFHGDPRPELGDGVVVVGELDGVHLGHQQVLAAARAQADATGSRVVAVVVAPDDAELRLADPAQRAELLEAAGVDECWLVPSVPEGLASSVEVEKVCTDDGEPITSTRVRDSVLAGDLATAAAMLGRPFELRGIVEHGDARGRTIGFPTANVAVPRGMALPPDGVYAGWYAEPDGTAHVSAINLGRRPTFYDENGIRLVEAHLLDFDGDLYGQLASVRFAQRLRAEVRFDGLDALKAQLARDVQATRDLLL